MKTINVGGGRFSADIEKTVKYYNSHSVCDCAGCRNFYAQINDKLPGLQAFLSEFGADAASPDELSYYTVDNLFVYDSAYTVAGKIEKACACQISICTVDVTINADYIPNEQTGAYFVITVHGISLPWVLNETIQ